MAEQYETGRTPSVKRTNEDLSPIDIQYNMKKQIRTMMADSDTGDYSQGGSLFDLRDTVESSDEMDSMNDSDLQQSQQVLTENGRVVIPEDAPEWAKTVFEQFQNQIDGITKSLEFAHGQIDTDMKKTSEAMDTAKQAKSMINKVLTQLGQRILILEEEKRVLQEKVVKMEMHSRQNNLVFYGFPEVRNETDLDCYHKVINVIQNLGLNPRMPIARAHRLGAYYKHQNTPRPIIVAFHWFGDRNAVWDRKQFLRQLGNNVFITEDFPEEIQTKRRILYPAFKKARRLPKYRGNVSLQKDKLILNNKSYTIENMHELPDEVNPWQLAHQEDRDALAFFGIQSPFSNFHPASFRVDGIDYNCTEQYLFYNKAARYGDLKAANQIMATKDPYKIKRISHRIKIVDKNVTAETWKKEGPIVMKAGLSAKFKQNPHLKHRLLATGQKRLIEGSKSDTFWGVGVSHKDPKVLNPENWKPGALNTLGKLLEEVRNEIAPFPILSRGVAAEMSDLSQTPTTQSDIEDRTGTGD